MIWLDLGLGWLTITSLRMRPKKTDQFGMTVVGGK